MFSLNLIYFLLFLFCTILKTLILIVPLLISVAYFTLAERKILGAIQRRRGPNVIGVFGLLQPLSDGLKLFAKEFVLPSSSNNLIFIIAPMLTFFLSLISWVVIPLNKEAFIAELNVSTLYVFAISSLGIYGVILSGWSSNSQYSFLGALRSAAQMISYEITLSFAMLIIAMTAGSYSFIEIVEAQKYSWFGWTYIPLFFIFFISGLAETNRHPFDLPEAEAELVSGYNVEYSSMSFALFSLGEYSNILIMSANLTIFFLGGWKYALIDDIYALKGLSYVTEPNADYALMGFDILIVLICSQFYGSWFAAKICFFVILFVWMRAVLPRYRYDQLMELGWKVLMPLTLFLFILSLFSLMTTNSFSY